MTEHELNPEFRFDAVLFLFCSVLFWVRELALKLEQLEVSIESPSMVVAIKEEAVVSLLSSPLTATANACATRLCCPMKVVVVVVLPIPMPPRAPCPMSMSQVRAGSVWRVYVHKYFEKLI